MGTATTKKVASSQLSESVKKSQAILQESSSRSAEAKQKFNQRTQDLQMLNLSKREIKDDIIKKVADIHMSPLSKGKELDEITRKAMTSTSKALKTAKQMAAEASREDEAAMKSSYKKTKKVMIESSSKIV